MQYYQYHNSFQNGQTVLVAHPRGFPPTPRGPESWEPATLEQVERLKDIVPTNHMRERFVRLYSLDFQPLAQYEQK